jgi:phosphate starvation-inducible PhoH-like protein
MHKAILCSLCLQHGAARLRGQKKEEPARSQMKKNIEIVPHIEKLFGIRDENLQVMESGLNVAIDLKSDSVQIEGAARDVARAEQIFTDFDHLGRSGHEFSDADLSSMLRVIAADQTATLRGLAEAGKQRSFGKRQVQPKSMNQRRYIDAIEKYDMVFGIGPAGTGKTYLAVAMAVSALNAKRVNRIILARPAVEAGERLGFLPGTLQEKVDPYLRPLYDALYDLMDQERVDRYLEKNVIEIAPIAFMRGRTLNDSFIILDEAQNTTPEQMKMFVTRMGFNAKMVITGDITQIDLPNARRSGLLEAMEVLRPVEGILFNFFSEEDVVRHHLVQRVVRAYDQRSRSQQMSLELPSIGQEPRASDLDDRPGRLETYREQDPKYRRAMAAYIEAEATLEDPVEGKPVKKGDEKAAGSVQDRIQGILGA